MFPGFRTQAFHISSVPEGIGLEYTVSGIKREYGGLLRGRLYFFSTSVDGNIGTFVEWIQIMNGLYISAQGGI